MSSGIRDASSSGVSMCEAQELVLRRALQRDELKIRVRLDRGANEPHLVARLAFDVENLLAAVAHLHERLLHVVLLDLLAGLRRNAEGERARAGVAARRPSRAPARRRRPSAA